LEGKWAEEHYYPNEEIQTKLDGPGLPFMKRKDDKKRKSEDQSSTSFLGKESAISKSIASSFFYPQLKKGQG
jgi:hypothetical protein